MDAVSAAKWVVFRSGARVNVHLVPSAELPEFIASLGRRVVAVEEYMGAAIAARHDAQGRCGGCAGGRGRLRCATCQERALSEQLGLSVAVGAAQQSLRQVMVEQREGARGARGEQR